MNSTLSIYSSFKKSGLLGFVLFALILILANSSNPPNGRTGAPGDSTCNVPGCHANASSTIDGDVTIAGLPTMITEGSTYPITVNVSNPNGIAVRGGFQWVALDQNNTNVGTISNPSSGSTLSTALGKTYHEHNPAQNFPANNIISWSADWTAPTGASGDVVSLYAASVIANGSGTSGDLTVFNKISGTIMPANTGLMVDFDNIQNVNCFGESTGSADAIVSGGTPPYSYNWNDGQTTSTAVGLVSDTYTVAVTDSNNNTGSGQIIITQNDSITITEQNNLTVSCSGGNDGSTEVIATGGTSPYLYNWSNNVTGPVNINLTAGDYTVTVIDNLLCESSITVTISDGAVINTASILQQDVSCNGGSDGQLEVLASGGSMPYSYDWSNGDSLALIQNLVPGNYDLTVTDANNCENISQYIINEPPAIIDSLINITQVTCHGDSTGQLSVEAKNGTPPYLYSWSNGSNGPILANLGAGNYKLTITDNNLCTLVDSFDISQPDSLIINLINLEDISCFGETDGAISIEGIGGNGGPYSYVWSTQDSLSDLSDLTAGTYIVTLSDNLDCTKTESFTITEPSLLIANLSSEPEFELGSMDGSATANPMGGTPPYMYIWNTDDTTMALNDISQGSYTVTVTDSNNCSSVESIVVNLSTCDLTVTSNTTPVSCFGETDGAAEINISNAVGTPRIIWSNGSDSTSITAVTGGSYSVSVSDDINCEVILNNVIVSEPGELMSFPRIAQAIACPGDSTGAITAAIIGGTAPFQFMWSDGSTNDTLYNIPTGSYAYTIIDSRSCSTNNTINLSASDIEAPVLQVQDFTIYIDSTGSVEAYDENDFNIGTSDNCGIAGYTFDILDLECNELGDYKIGITVFDVNGNFDRDSVTVTLADTIAPIFQCVTDTLYFNGCNQVNYSRPLVNDNCSSGTLDIELAKGLVTGSTFPIGETEIIYTAEDDNGNLSSCNFIIIVDAELSLDFITEDPTCFNFSDGSVDIIVNNSVVGDSIVTIEGDFDPDFLGEGNYTVTVVDASMCEATDSFTITDPPVLIVDMTESIDPSTSNSNDGSINITVLGGVGDLNFEWTKDGVTLADTTEDLSNIGPGTYMVTITDEQGCSFTSLEIVLDALVSTYDAQLADEIRLFPNPVNDLLYISSNNKETLITEIELYDAQSALILRSSLTDGIIDMSSIADGLYLIRIYVNDRLTSKKIIKH